MVQSTQTKKKEKKKNEVEANCKFYVSKFFSFAFTKLKYKKSIRISYKTLTQKQDTKAFITLIYCFTILSKKFERVKISSVDGRLLTQWLLPQI